MSEISLPPVDNVNSLMHASLLFEPQPSGLYLARWQEGIDGAAKVADQTAHAGEDVAADLQKVEHRYSFSRVAASTLVKSGSGLLHTLTFSCADSAPTAGTIDVYDGTSTSGTLLHKETLTTTFFRSFSILLDAEISSGIYVNYTTTADVACAVSYR